MTSFVEAARRGKLKALVARGVAPFAHRYDPTTAAPAPQQGPRWRDADLPVRPPVREACRLRSRAGGSIRKFLAARGYLEVETPVLQPLYGGATARPFTTHAEALDTDLYLRIADELYLKRCIVGGLEKVYEIGHDFRNEGLSRFHNPHFTIAAWYEPSP